MAVRAASFSLTSWFRDERVHREIREGHVDEDLVALPLRSQEIYVLRSIRRESSHLLRLDALAAVVLQGHQ